MAMGTYATVRSTCSGAGAGVCTEEKGEKSFDRTGRWQPVEAVCIIAFTTLHRLVSCGRQISFGRVHRGLDQQPFALCQPAGRTQAVTPINGAVWFCRAGLWKPLHMGVHLTFGLLEANAATGAIRLGSHPAHLVLPG